MGEERNGNVERKSLIWWTHATALFYSAASAFPPTSSHTSILSFEFGLPRFCISPVPGKEASLSQHHCSWSLYCPPSTWFRGIQCGFSHECQWYSATFFFSNSFSSPRRFLHSNYFPEIRNRVNSKHLQLPEREQEPPVFQAPARFTNAVGVLSAYLELLNRILREKSTPCYLTKVSDTDRSHFSSFTKGLGFSFGFHSWLLLLTFLGKLKVSWLICNSNPGHKAFGGGFKSCVFKTFSQIWANSSSCSRWHWDPMWWGLVVLNSLN